MVLVYTAQRDQSVTDVLKKSTQMGINVINFEKKIAKLFDKNMD